MVLNNVQNASMLTLLPCIVVRTILHRMAITGKLFQARLVLKTDLKNLEASLDL